MDSFPAIGISGINACENPGPGVPVAKCLRTGGWAGRLVGLGYAPYDAGHFLRQYLDDSALMTSPGLGWESFRSRLLTLCGEHGLGAVIPCIDAELPLYVRFQKELSQEGVRTFLPTETQFDLCRRDNLADLATRLGLSHPKTRRVTSLAEFEEVWRGSSKPVFIKGPHFRAYRAFSWDEAVRNAGRLVLESGWPVFVQDTLYGDELNVVGLGDGEGGHYGMVAMKKINGTPTGKIWSGVTLRHPEIEAAVENFIRLTRWRGPFELECIVDGEGLRLLGVSPRFPAWVAFSAAVGVNLPLRLAQLLFGETPERGSDYETGRLFMRYTDDLVTDLDRLESVMIR